MACWVQMIDLKCPHGKCVHVLLDISAPPDGRQYAVVQSLDGDAFDELYGADFVSAAEVADILCEFPLPGGPDTSWRAVLDRLMCRPPEQPGQLAGSPVEYASNFFHIGTWNWLVTLADIRQRRQEA